MIKAYHSELGSIPYSLQNLLTFNFPYPCESYSICSPYEITFYPGRYQLQIWGASGGNLTRNKKFAQGGKGGYSTGVFTVKQNTEVLYLYLGGQNNQNPQGGDPKSDPTYNGGGITNNENDAPGGGASDFRTIKGNDWNDTLDSRILVAGGGGGAWVSAICGNLPYAGGDGGGENGFPGEGCFCPSQYGTQTGTSENECDDDDVDGNHESYGRGGSGWGSGGGGYHGGSSVDGGAGGGGSGFIDKQAIKSYGSIQDKTTNSNHFGPGRAIITILSVVHCTLKINNNRYHIFTSISILCVFK